MERFGLEKLLAKLRQTGMGPTENEGPENGGPKKNKAVENAGLKTQNQQSQGGIFRTGKRRTKIH